MRVISQEIMVSCFASGKSKDSLRITFDIFGLGSCFLMLIRQFKTAGKLGRALLLRHFTKSSQLTIDSYVSVCSSSYEARGKFGEHERCVRVARGVAESNSSFLSGKCIFPRDLFADVMSVHNRNMKHVRAIEFD